MAEFFDTHAHLDGFEGEAGLAGMLDRAAAAGVTRLIAMGGNPGANRTALAAARSHPGHIAAAVGLDRDRAARPDLAAELAGLRGCAGDPAVAAIGESGLDYHYGADRVDAQRALFRRMTELAREADLPLVVHSREAEEDTLSLLRAHVEARGGTDRTGVLHCFTGDASFAARLVELGLYISFSGILTFRNAETIRAAAAAVPEDRLLLETDTPYLAPAPHRGRENEPALLVHVAEALARVRGWSIDAVAQITTRNAVRLFGPGGPGGRGGGKAGA